MVRASVLTDGNVIKAVCYAEGNDRFTMTINRNDWTVIQCSRRQDMYSAHVLAKIVEEYRKTGTVPDMIESVWF